MAEDAALSESPAKSRPETANGSNEKDVVLAHDGVSMALLEKQYLEWRTSNRRKPLITISEPVSEYAIPVGTALASLRKRSIHECMRVFGEVSVRDKFLHSPLCANDRLRCHKVIIELLRRGTREDDIFLIYTRIPRFVLFNYRKQKAAYLEPAVQHCLEIIEWYKSDFFPISDTEPKLREMLDCGVAYWKGRDRQHRPILVLRPTSKMMCPTAFERLIIFNFEWARQFLFVPGVSETAVIWFDLTKINLTRVPYNEVQAVISKLTVRYPFHLDNFYIIHDSIFIQTLTPIVRSFMTELQRLKIRIYRRKIPRTEMRRFDEGSVERRYGGNRPAITQFYPFPLHTTDISDPQILEVWDPTCIEGVPHIVKELPLAINTEQVLRLVERLQEMNEVDIIRRFQLLLEQHHAEVLQDRTIILQHYDTLPALHPICDLPSVHTPAPDEIHSKKVDQSLSLDADSSRPACVPSTNRSSGHLVSIQADSHKGEAESAQRNPPEG